MKRPRRPVKKRKPAPKKIVKRKKAARPFNRTLFRLKIEAKTKEALARKRAVPEWTAADAAVFDIPQPPAGFSYQWAPFGRVVYMLSQGWEQVPYRRHPELPRSLNFEGYVVYRDTALFQISSALVEADLQDEAQKAEEQTSRFAGGEGRGFHILSPSFMVDSDYERYPDDHPPFDVELTITLRVSARWCEVANAMKLDHAEYARRRIAQSGFLIAPDDKGIFSPFELVTKKVEG